MKIIASLFSFLLFAQVKSEDVKVDLVPCIFASGDIERDVGAVSESYMTSLFFDGFWSATKREYPNTSSGTLIEDYLYHTLLPFHGKCNVVFVGFAPSEDQKSMFQEYSRIFNVRVIYFNNAQTGDDAEVNSRLSISQSFLEPLLSAEGVKLTTSGGTDTRVVKSDMAVSLRETNLFFRPVHIYGTGTGGTTTVMADYIDENGDTLLSAYPLPSVAMAKFVSDPVAGSAGYEEMHVFFSMGWFDVGSWAMLHYLVEWGTKGVFQGERRFHLSGVVDDLFLSTGVFEYNGGDNEGSEFRLTSSNMDTFNMAENSLNTVYGSSIKTEFAFNGAGILDEVDSNYILPSVDDDFGLLPKGDPPIDGGLPPAHSTTWLQTAVTGMKTEFDSGMWSSDLLLKWFLDNDDKVYMQGHTLSHVDRDNLGVSDCSVEDIGNVQIAVITGLFANDNYNWRSMVNPGITGLFNPMCLQSAMDNLMKCGPGDNTYNPSSGTSVSLVSSVSDYHSIYTTTGTDGVSRFQIAPRFATNVYFNCITGKCLVDENEMIRRTVCGCENLDPGQPKGSCSSDEDQCTGENGIQSFGSIDALFDTEAFTTTRSLLSGRRDKYMFHQANLIPAGDLSGKSAMEHWYTEVFKKFSSYIDFPATSMKFDDLCTDFAAHEDLDSSGAVVTVTLDSFTGIINSLSLDTDVNIGYIPLTFPESMVVSTSGLVVGSTEVYGSDKTYYISTSTGDIPSPATIPDVSELAPVPVAPVTGQTLPLSKNNRCFEYIGTSLIFMGALDDSKKSRKTCKKACSGNALTTSHYFGLNRGSNSYNCYCVKNDDLIVDFVSSTGCTKKVGDDFSSVYLHRYKRE